MKEFFTIFSFHGTVNYFQKLEIFIFDIPPILTASAGWVYCPGNEYDKCCS